MIHIISFCWKAVCVTACMHACDHAFLTQLCLKYDAFRQVKCSAVLACKVFPECKPMWKLTGLVWQVQEEETQCNSAECSSLQTICSLVWKQAWQVNFHSWEVLFVFPKTFISVGVGDCAREPWREFTFIHVTWYRDCRFRVRSFSVCVLGLILFLCGQDLPTKEFPTFKHV